MSPMSACVHIILKYMYVSDMYRYGRTKFSSMHGCLLRAAAGAMAHSHGAWAWPWRRVCEYPDTFVHGRTKI
eukprot:SAG31_NODE_330_length_17593_cov_4.817891_14_plen_72_part_00